MEEEDRDVITTLQVERLAQFFGPQELESRRTPFQEAEDDEHILAQHVLKHEESSLSRTSDYIHGPPTRNRAKKLQEQVNSFLTDCNFDTSKNVILPKCSILILLRFTHEDVEGTWPKDQDTVLQNSSIGKVTRTDVRT